MRKHVALIMLIPCLQSTAFTSSMYAGRMAYKEQPTRGPDTKTQRTVVSSLNANLRLLISKLKSGRVGYARYQLNKLCRKSYDTETLLVAAQAYLYPPINTVQAQKRIQRILKKEPGNRSAALLSGKCHLYEGDLDKAELCYQEILRSDPYDMLAIHGLADVELMRGRADKAVELLAQSLTTHPHCGRTAKSLVKMGDMMLACAKSKDDLKKACHWYRKALDVKRNDKAYAGLVSTLLLLDEKDKARAVLSTLRDEARRASFALWVEGMLHEYAGHVSNAASAFYKATQAQAKNWYAQYALAKLYAGYCNIATTKSKKLYESRYKETIDVAKAIQVYELIRKQAVDFPLRERALDFANKLPDCITAKSDEIVLAQRIMGFSKGDSLQVEQCETTGETNTNRHAKLDSCKNDSEYSLSGEQNILQAIQTDMSANELIITLGKPDKKVSLRCFTGAMADVAQDNPSFERWTYFDGSASKGYVVVLMGGRVSSAVPFDKRSQAMN